MKRTLLDEDFRVRGRKNGCVTPAEIQRDLDRFLAQDNGQCSDSDASGFSAHAAR